MNEPINHMNEQQVALAFTGQSAIFDQLYGNNGIVGYKRERVRQFLLKYLVPGSRVLELNAGTGDDAIFLAKQGHYVHATDISTGMQAKLREKLAVHNMDALVTQELCSFTSLETLSCQGPYDCIFSNFAGLNCTGDLKKVLTSFDSLLKPDGFVVLVVLPRFCLWETMFMLKGKFKTATRRFFSSGGRKARIGVDFFTCWYYSPGFIRRNLKEKFEFKELEGLCTMVPPSYIENFPENFPRLYNWLCIMENRFKSSWPWKYIGDYYIISLQKAHSV
ncbi:MAG TPA: class I SAM-dependent methyltransferase [Puia sp.]